jgi:hypothetical protein
LVSHCLAVRYRRQALASSVSSQIFRTISETCPASDTVHTGSSDRAVRAGRVSCRAGHPGMQQPQQQALAECGHRAVGTRQTPGRGHACLPRPARDPAAARAGTWPARPPARARDKPGRPACQLYIPRVTRTSPPRRGRCLSLSGARRAARDRASTSPEETRAAHAAGLARLAIAMAVVHARRGAGLGGRPGRQGEASVNGTCTYASGQRAVIPGLSYTVRCPVVTRQSSPTPVCTEEC